MAGETALQAACDGFDSHRLHNFDFVAQLVEQYTFNVWVVGSSPTGVTNLPKWRNGRRAGLRNQYFMCMGSSPIFGTKIIL
jgi:hypothetical protein